MTRRHRREGPTTIALVDDGSVFMHGLATLLQGGGHDVRTGASLEELGFEQGGYAAAVLDVAAVAEPLRIAWQRCALVFIVDPEPSTAVHRQAFRLGASAVIRRDDPAELILRDIELAIGGETVLPSVVARRIASAGGDATELEALDPADREVLVALAEGITVAQLARRLCRSQRDCYRLLARLYQRMGVSGRSQAIAAAAAAGLVTVPR